MGGSENFVMFAKFSLCNSEIFFKIYIYIIK